MTIYTTMPSPVGQLLLVGLPAKDGVRLTSVSMDGQRYAPEVQAGWRADPEPFAEVIRQLAAYFDGSLTNFDLDLAPRGTDFQQRIWPSSTRRAAPGRPGCSPRSSAGTWPRCTTSRNCSAPRSTWPGTGSAPASTGTSPTTCPNPSASCASGSTRTCSRSPATGPA